MQKKNNKEDKPKKRISKQQRSDIREAVDSIPSLIIEHVSFPDTSSMPNYSNNTEDPRQKYLLSSDKKREHQKKRQTVFIGVGIILCALIGLWVINAKTFFFDASHTTSNEEELLKTMREDFNSTVGLITKETPTTTPTTTASSTVDIEQLTDALSTLFATTSASSTATSTKTTTTTEISSTTTTSSIQMDSTSSTTSTR